MIQIRTIVAGYLVLVASTAAAAQGVFNFDDIPGVNQEPVIAIDINSIAIGFVRAMTREFDPATADILEGLRGIRLRVYQGAENTRQFNDFIGSLTERLEASGWQRVMFVQDESTSVRVHMQMTAAAVSGMTVMLFDGAEAVFINIDGTLNASDLGRIMATFNVQDVLGAMPALSGSSPAEH